MCTATEEDFSLLINYMGPSDIVRGALLWLIVFQLRLFALWEAIAIQECIKLSFIFSAFGGLTMYLESANYCRIGLLGTCADNKIICAT